MSSPFRYTAPVPHKSATGRTAEVYAQIASDFGIERAATFAVLSPAPELMAAAWALLRESLIAGAGSRTDRELVSYGVSLANRCPFCIGAHTLLLHATGDHRLAETLARGERPADQAQEQLIAWGEASRVPGSEQLWPLPFAAEHTAAQVGTALTFHFINRIVSALLVEQLLPYNAQRLRVVRSLAGRSVAKTVRRAHLPGTSLPFTDDAGSGPAWAARTTVGPAYAALRTAATSGAELLDAADLALVDERMAAWDGTHPPLTGDGIPDRSHPGARLVLLAALAPYRITDEDVRAWRTARHTDRCLVRLIAYGAFRAVRRIETALPLTAPPAARSTAAGRP